MPRSVQSNMSNASCTELRRTPGQSPAPAMSPALNVNLGGSSTKKHELYRPDPCDYGEEDNSFLVGMQEDSLHVAYADPRQNGELDKLKILFQAEAGADAKKGKGKSPWEMDLDMDKELTLPQAPDGEVSGSGKRPVARGRRGRGCR